MKFQYHKILIKGQSIWVIVVFLALSLGFSLANKLSEDYETTIPVEIKLRNYNHLSMIFSTDVIRVDVRIFGSGITLLKYKLTKPQINISLDRVFPQQENSRFYGLPTEQLLQLIEDQLKEVQVRSISPDHISFRAQKVIKKKIPVRLIEWVSYKEQYFSSHKKLTPDSVWINGPEAIVDTMTRVSTKLYSAKKIANEISEYIDLDLPKSVVCDVKAIHYRNIVERYTQNVVRVPIQLMNNNSSSKVLFLPSYTEIFYKVPLREVRQVQDTMFILGVKYQELMESKSGLVKVHIIKSPIPKTSIQLRNPFVEYIIFPSQP